MRVNVYAEEMTDRIEIIAKEIDGHKFTGLRIYLALPVTLPEVTDWSIRDEDGKVTKHVQGPFLHRPGDDDSSAVTFWGKRDLRTVLQAALQKLHVHYRKGEHTYGIVDTDNYGGDCPNESWVASGIASRKQAEIIADALNAKGGQHSLRFYKVEPETYVLQPGFEP